MGRRNLRRKATPDPFPAMNKPSRFLLLAVAALPAPLSALPAVQGVQVGNVTSSSVCICWETTETAAPGLAVFADAAGTQSLAGQVRVEIQPVENHRREVSSSYATRQQVRDLQSLMEAKRVALVRVSGLAPDTEYHLRPLALDSVGTPLADGPLTPVTTARTSVFVPEARQLLVDLAPLVPTTGEVAGALVIVRHPASPWPLIAVTGDSFSPTVARVDLTELLEPSGKANLLPAAGPLELEISWKGLLAVPGSFLPDRVPYTGATTVAAATQTTFVGSGEAILAAAGGAPYAVAGLPFILNLLAKDLAGVPLPDFDRPLLVESPALAGGAGATAPLVDGQLAHPVVFSGPGTHTVTVRDPGSAAQTTVEVTVVQMNYRNWRIYHMGGELLPNGEAGADPDHDRLRNEGEYVFWRDPLRPSGAVASFSRPPAGALRLRFDLNPYQTEYAVVIEVSNNLRDWRRSAKLPAVAQSLPGRNLMEVVWTAAELQAETASPSPRPAYFARVLTEPANSFDTWLAAYGLTGPAAGPTANPDGDRDPNYVEFAFDSDPLSGLSSGKIRRQLVDFGGTLAQVLTLPVRHGAVPAPGDPPGGELVFNADGVRYRIQGSGNLASWTLDVSETVVSTADMPLLSPGYIYRSFRTPGGLTSLEFLRARVEQYP
jgi:hypothetical protein